MPAIKHLGSRGVTLCELSAMNDSSDLQNMTTGLINIFYILEHRHASSSSMANFPISGRER